MLPPPGKCEANYLLMKHALMPFIQDLRGTVSSKYAQLHNTHNTQNTLVLSI